jgi:hypothetical protein
MAKLPVTHHQIGIHLRTEATLQVSGNRLAQRSDAAGRRVAVVAVTQGLDRRFDDMVGCLEIRLPDAEVDDRASLGLQFRSTAENRQGAFAVQAVDACRGS